MERPTTRVLAVLEMLQAQGCVSGPVLASRVCVDVRTLRRYIALLEELGIPITAGRGRHGGYSLVAGFKLPPMMFTDDEALALSLGLIAARGLGLADTAPAVASAQAKLERVMPTNLRHRVRAVDETVQLDLSRAGVPAGDNDVLAALSAAAQARRRVRLRYRTLRETTEREFDAYGLAWRSGRWYAVGHCHLRKGMRSFRLDRVDAVHPTETPFERPERFDALGHLAFSVATLPRTHAIEVLLRTDLASARREVLPGIGLMQSHADGVLLFAQADDLDWFARELARLPFEFSVRGPRALRTAVHACGERLQRLALA